MTLARVQDLLTRGEVIAQASLAPGFPLWLPYGTRLAERFDAVYAEELFNRTPCTVFEPPLLVAEQAYVAAVSDSVSYCNMYALDRGGVSYLVRPDNLVAAAELIRRRRCPDPVIVQGSLYRAETGSARPLVRDREIWRATQVVHNVVDRETTATLRLHTDAFAAFLERLCVPSLALESGPLRDHSTRGVLTLAFPSEHEVALTSTTYVLAPAMLRRLGLDGGLVEVGFTAKLLATAIALHADAAGIVLASELAPDAVVIGARTAEDGVAAVGLARELGGADNRISVSPESWHRTLRRCRRRGTPLVILADCAQGHRLIHRLDGRSMPLGRDAVTAVRRALAEHDEELRRRAARAMETALSRSTCIRIGAAPAEGEWHRLGRVAAGSEAGWLAVHARRRRLS